ncbi:acylphosphatase [Dyella silvatica]|uniref:acylphosphatase n=1 Tax=Dyella silvatica TaxID=2992128 RepID=UPI0022533310|nr:acylphosphatase [Dyella silvatica]
MSTVKFTVSGRVQGVFYRAGTREQALELGLTGYAKNLPDGSVEVLASGSGQAIEALERWLWHGPPAAKVESVLQEYVQVPPPIGFVVA